MPQRRPPAARLAAYERRYHNLAAKLADIGFIASGTVTRRFTRCGKPGCRCQGDPSQPHGPYYQWTAKEAGKTVTRRLSPREAALYEEWIANDRKLRRLVSQMRKVAGDATDLILRTDQTGSE